MTALVSQRRSSRWRLLALLAAALIVVSACGSSTPSSAPEASTAPPPSAQPSATDGQPSAVASPSPTPAAGSPLSETLIAAALAAGTITYEQSLLYRALALFDSPGLPQEFRSPVPDMDAATALLGEIDQKEAELSPGLLEKLAPYRARPADPISIFNNPPGQGSRGIMLAVATPPPTWVSRPVDGTGARVWVKDGPFTETQLERIADAVARVWPQLPGVFRYGEPDKPGVPNLSINPDSAIDLYFVETGTLDLRDPYCLIFPGNQACSLFVGAYGYAQRAEMKHGTSSSGYVVINAGLPDAQLLDTVAHELTHVGQFAYDRNESSWLMESTATWAAYRVMKKLNLLPAHEYEWLTGTPFFAELSVRLAKPNAHSAFHSYASWLYFLFASMEAGDAIVTKIWEAAAALGVQSEKAVDQAFLFDDHFADFAVRNWNQDSVTPQYKDADATFPGGLKPETEGGSQVMTGAGEARLGRWVYPLASVYYAYKFENAVRKITFENAYVGVPHAHVWAIKKIGDRWVEPEDWTGDAKREFCRDVPQENVTELVIIVSDSDSNMSNDGLVAQDPRVVTETTGCVGWVGEIRGQTRPRGSPNWNNGYQETSLAQVSFVPNPWGAADELEFVLGSGTVSWTSQWIVPPTDMSKPGIELCPTTVFSGSYEPTPYDQFAERPDQGRAVLDFRPPPDGAPTAGPDSSQYALRQYEAEGLSNLSGNSSSIIPDVPCEPHGGVSSSWWHVPREALATASADGRTIEGTWTSPGTESEDTWTWVLHYVGPP